MFRTKKNEIAINRKPLLPVYSVGRGLKRRIVFAGWCFAFMHGSADSEKTVLTILPAPDDAVYARIEKSTNDTALISARQSLSRKSYSISDAIITEKSLKFTLSDTVKLVGKIGINDTKSVTEKVFVLTKVCGEQ